jgi:hypothetical protein
MEDQEMAYAKLRECSGGQPTYRVEVCYSVMAPEKMVACS